MRWDWAETSERTAAAWSEVSAAFFDVFESARMAGNSQWVRQGALVGIEAAERGLRLDPEHEACKRELSRALVSLALQDFDDRLFELARTRLARARGLREWLSARAPNSLRTTLDLLSVRQKETSVLSELGQYEAAERALLGLRPLVARAVALDPNVVSTRMLEVVLYARLAHNALKGHQAQKALGYAKREVLLAEGISIEQRQRSFLGASFSSATTARPRPPSARVRGQSPRTTMRSQPRCASASWPSSRTMRSGTMAARRCGFVGPRSRSRAATWSWHSGS